jgi:hypothetical protein
MALYKHCYRVRAAFINVAEATRFGRHTLSITRPAINKCIIRATYSPTTPHTSI